MLRVEFRRGLVVVTSTVVGVVLSACGLADLPQFHGGASSGGEGFGGEERLSESTGPISRGGGSLRALLQKRGVAPPERTASPSPEVFELGKKLFFDKALSGNKDVACATCHFTSPGADTGDGLSLGVGVGGVGSVPDRRLGPGKEFEPRHSIELFNRGLKGWDTQFWDARVQEGPNGQLVTPAGSALQSGLIGVVEAQAMFPVTSRVEMRGDASDPNPISQVSDGNLSEIWSKLMDRLLQYSGYRQLFRQAYPNTPLSQLKFRDAANAIGQWEREAYTFLDSPFDRFLKGDDTALSKKEKRGGRIFYGKGNCVACHSGSLTTDQEFHNIAAPQIGPGKGSTKPLDPGRFIVTGDVDDKFEFRTPPLRNVELTPPYMHSGAYQTLEGAIEHHLNPRKALRNYDGSQLRKELRKELHNSASARRELLRTLDPVIRRRVAIQRRGSRAAGRGPFVRGRSPGAQVRGSRGRGRGPRGGRITERDVDRLVAFLKAMTSRKADRTVPNTAPSSVPSGLLEDGT